MHVFIIGKRAFLIAENNLKGSKGIRSVFFSGLFKKRFICNKM
ncbi:hypothetical protein CHCC14600_4652 [Bacillus licheniformis]|nr:hypothetical protein CHCC14600_4652 [Bacillus licheniformis]